MLTSVDIPDGVTSIGDNAFYDCEELASAIIPVSATSIGYNAFSQCGITDASGPDGTPGFKFGGSIDE